MSSDEDSDDDDDVYDEATCEILNITTENKILDHSDILFNTIKSYCIENGCSILDNCRTLDLYHFLISFCNKYIPDEDIYEQ